MNLDLIYQDRQNNRNNKCKDFLNYAPPSMPLSCVDFGKLEQATENLRINNDYNEDTQESYRGIEFENIDDIDFQMNIDSCNNSMNDSGIDLEIEEYQINESQENSRDEEHFGGIFF